jgi:hypothetical protein
MIYDARLSDGVRGHDRYTKFQKDWFRHSKIAEGGYRNRQRHTDSEVI